MSWEIAVGIATMIGALCAVLEVILRVNRSLISLESAVNQLLQFMSGQSERNNRFEKTLNRHEQRILLLEARSASPEPSHSIRKEDRLHEEPLHEDAAGKSGSGFFQNLA